MRTRTFKGIALLCLVVALTAGIAAAIGVFARGSGQTAHATSIRGEEFDYAIDGVYAYNAERVVAEGVGWDALTLFFAAPALLIAVPFVARGSLRARLFAAGILGYLVYQYLMYAVFWALGPLFPVFIVLYPLAFIGIIWIVATLDVGTLSERFTDRFPRRSIPAFCAVMGLQLVAMWVPRIAAGLSGDLAGANLLGTPTLAVQALDLGIVVPIAFATAVFAWRRRPVGYLLAALFSIKGVTMSGAIVAMLVSAWIVEGAPEVPPLLLFSAATLVSGVIALLIFRSVREDVPAASIEAAAA